MNLFHGCHSTNNPIKAKVLDFYPTHPPLLVNTIPEFHFTVYSLFNCAKLPVVQADIKEFLPLGLAFQSSVLGPFIS